MADKLADTEKVVMQARDAAEDAGDLDEADLQDEVLGELDFSAEQVADAELTAQEYVADAERAADYGQYEDVSENEMRAYDAETQADIAQAELEELIDRAREMATQSLAQRLNPMAFAAAAGTVSPNDVARAVGSSVSLARAAVHSRLDDVLGGAPVLVALLELLTLLSPSALLAVIFMRLRRDAEGEVNVRTEVLLLSHLYWALYYAGLAVTTVAMHAEPPLMAFARAQPREYVVYQVAVLTLYLAYISLLARHWLLVRTRHAAAQCATAGIVLAWTYVTVTYPAVAQELPPTCGPLTFAAFALLFVNTTRLIRDERKGKGE